MANANAPLYAFNRGILSPNALSRVDLGRTALSAEIQRNWMPRALGSMSLRPGLEYIGNILNDAVPTLVPFIFSTSDTAIIELTELALRVWIDDQVVSRGINNTTVANGDFEFDLAEWTADSDTGGTAAWDGGRLMLRGTGFAAGRVYQQILVATDDVEQRHGLNIEVVQGPVILRVGQALGEDDYIGEVSLSTGSHSLGFTPDFPDLFIQLESALQHSVLVDSVKIAPQGEIVLTTPWLEHELGGAAVPGTETPSKVRYDQSGDVVFIAVDGHRQRRIERRADDSWSIVEYLTEDGPYRLENTGPITIAPSAITGDVTLATSSPLFREDLVGALFSISSTGQKVTAIFTAADQASDPIKVEGTGTQREFSWTLSGTWVGTVRVQRSVESPGAWVDLEDLDETTNATYTLDDAFDNSIIYYRLVASAYTSGTIEVSVDYASGSLRGTARITNVVSATEADAIVLKAFGGVTPSAIWREGAWSDYRGYPSTVKLYEGRLFWAGKDKIWGSVTDAFNDFDPFTVGDSGPISRTIGFGPVDTISWMEGIQRLLLGTQGAEMSIRSSSDNEPLTPANFNIKAPSNQGSHVVDAEKIDSSVVFIARNRTRVYEVAFDFENNDYTSRELSLHVPDLGEPLGYSRIVVQRHPDTRIHCVRRDGMVAMLLFNKAENLLCWIEIETDGVIREAVSLPGIVEDVLYYAVQRVVDGETKMFLEKWATERENKVSTSVFPESFGPIFNPLEETFEGQPLDGLSCSPNTIEDGTIVTLRMIYGPGLEGDKAGSNLTVEDDGITTADGFTQQFFGGLVTPSALYLSDSHVRYAGEPTDVLTGYQHLEGREVVVWADGKDQGTFTVSGGQVTLPTGTNAEIATGGLHYQAKFRSSKLAYADEAGTALNQVKRVDHIGLILRNTHHLGIRYGKSFDEADLRDLTQVVQGASVPLHFVHCEFDERMQEHGDDFDTDTRIHLVADAPRPVTLLSTVISMNTTDDV